MQPPPLVHDRGAAPASHLLIHRDDDGASLGKGWGLDSLLRLLRARVAAAPQRGRAGLRVEIHDLSGQAMMVVEQAPALIDLPLPAGIYQVSTERCGLRRRYTVALGQGESLDLYLRPADSATR